MTNSHITSFGIPGIDAVPYGIHICHFYHSQQELIAWLAPFFVAGLSRNERCIWIASPPIPAKEISTQAAKSPELQQGITSGQLKIMDSAEWHGESAALDPEKVMQRWIQEEERALSDGFHGLRITADTARVPRDSWSCLMTYEEKLHSWLKDRRIVACCSYHRHACEPVDMLEVAHRHDGAVDLSGDRWEVFVRSPNLEAWGRRANTR